MSKYNARKTEFGGHVFDSKKEAARYSELMTLEYAGEINHLKLQPRFLLQEKFRDNQGKMHRAIHYVADFRYLERGKDIVEDTKGFKTDVFRIKEKLFRKQYPNIIFIIGE